MQCIECTVHIFHPMEESTYLETTWRALLGRFPTWEYSQFMGGRLTVHKHLLFGGIYEFWDWVTMSEGKTAWLPMLHWHTKPYPWLHCFPYLVYPCKLAIFVFWDVASSARLTSVVSGVTGGDYSKLLSIATWTRTIILLYRRKRCFAAHSLHSSTIDSIVLNYSIVLNATQRNN